MGEVCSKPNIQSQEAGEGVKKQAEIQCLNFAS